MSKRGEGAIRLTPRRRFIRPGTDLIALMFVVVTVEAEQLPVTTVRRVVMMVVVLVMDGELTQLFAFKFSSAVRADPREYFQRPSTVGLLVFAPYHASLHEKGDPGPPYSTPIFYTKSQPEHPTRGEMGPDTDPQ